MSEIKHTIVVDGGGPISADALRYALMEAGKRIRTHRNANPAVVAADYARSMGHKVDPAAAFKAEHLCDETVYLMPPETAMQRAQRMLQSESARMLAAETAKPMSDTVAVSGEGYSSEHRVDWHKHSRFVTLLPVQAPDIGPAEPVIKGCTITEPQALAGHRWDTSEWPNGKPDTTYMIDGIPLAAATVQRADLLHAALAKTEAAARFVPAEAREGARISDVAGIAAAEKEEQVESFIEQVLAAPRVERKAGVKEAITGLTTAASGDHRFGRWGAVE